MKDLKDLRDLVGYVLLNYPSTRDKDELLYLEILRLKGYEMNADTFLNYKDYNLPSFSSISRERRRVQEDERLSKHIVDWKLQSTKAVEKFRRELEKQYRNYYRD
ncbi:hypothetical protein [Helcococcus sueciensis]|uniref:hypothetical protein n=1 Tax=Helcococcus sueciensis TaxID=241555 RepID=UPI000413DBCE|nr:hypothetical protein [Helcococcus sueciensis]